MTRSVYVAEPCGELITAERDTDLSTKNGRLRHLMRELGVTRPHAHALLRDYVRDQRAADARQLAGEEFGVWVQRRGDIISLRSKPRANAGGWRVTSS